MLIKREADWKTLLTPKDEKRMNDIIKNLEGYKTAFRSAEDVKIAQLWCAVLELKKENAALYSKTKKLEGFFNAIIEKYIEDKKKQEDMLTSLEEF
ncbi:MAG: hypothetical protein J4473_03195 [Candidatus Aenigmarchaeota archaeon]|nr:hypothetical protein [Candidatus Aenigmarchaeota archaeon]